MYSQDLNSIIWLLGKEEFHQHFPLGQGQEQWKCLRYIRNRLEPHWICRQEELTLTSNFSSSDDDENENENDSIHILPPFHLVQLKLPRTKWEEHMAPLRDHRAQISLEVDEEETVSITHSSAA
jgi:hypothetical protein